MCDDNEATLDEVIEARMLYASDEIEIDEEPAVSRADDGVWVAAWVWLAKPVKEEKPEPEPKAEIRIKKICGECGSEDVCIDAWSTWDEVTQEWVLGPIFEDCFCNGREQQCDIVDEEIKP